MLIVRHFYKMSKENHLMRHLQVDTCKEEEELLVRYIESLNTYLAVTYKLMHRTRRLQGTSHME